MIRRRPLVPKIVTRAFLLLGFEQNSIDSVESLKKRVSEIFPHITWERPTYMKSPVADMNIELEKTDHETWFGLGLPEFTIIPKDEDGSVVSALWVSRVDREGIRLLEQKLDLVSLDMGKGILGMLFD
jgi:hypothetical protein